MLNLYSLLLTFCFLNYIPRTSFQDQTIDLVDTNLKNTNNDGSQTDSISGLIRWLSERNIQYETAYYVLLRSGQLSGFGKLFEKLGKMRREQLKGLVDISSVLDLDIQLESITSYSVYRPFKLLQYVNKTNIVEIIKDFKRAECTKGMQELNEVYSTKLNDYKDVPLQMYLKLKVYNNQLYICKILHDLWMRMNSMLKHSRSTSSKIPIAFEIVDKYLKNRY